MNNFVLYSCGLQPPWAWEHLKSIMRRASWYTDRSNWEDRLNSTTCLTPHWIFYFQIPYVIAVTYTLLGQLLASKVLFVELKGFLDACEKSGCGSSLLSNCWELELIDKSSLMILQCSNAGISWLINRFHSRKTMQDDVQIKHTHTHTHIKSLKIMIPLKSIFYCNTGRRIFFNRACLPCHKECYVAGKDDENKLSKVRGQPQVSKYDVPRACLWNQSTNRDELSTRNPCTNNIQIVMTNDGKSINDVHPVILICQVWQQKVFRVKQQRKFMLFVASWYSFEISH